MKVEFKTDVYKGLFRLLPNIHFEYSIYSFFNTKKGFAIVVTFGKWAAGVKLSKK